MAAVTGGNLAQEANPGVITMLRKMSSMVLLMGGNLLAAPCTGMDKLMGNMPPAVCCRHGPLSE